LEPSSSSAVPPEPPPADPRQGKWKALDRLAMGGLGFGLALYVLPVGQWAIRIAFFICLVFTFFHILTSHKRKPEQS